MTAVLILSPSAEIEALLADLVIFAGYHPVLLRQEETVADAVRDRGIELVLLDPEHPVARDGGWETSLRGMAPVAVVYCGGSLSAGELHAFAEARGACHFPLPNGPRLLAAVLGEALERVGRGASRAIGTPPPEVVDALRTVAQAQRLAVAARAAVRENHRLRDERDALLAMARSGRDQLHGAVLQYLATLRHDGLPRERALELVNTALRETAEAAGAPELLASIGRDTQQWVEEAYCAA